MAKVRFAPQRSPNFPPINIREAITRVYSVIAVWRPTTVVSRSATTWEMDTFITVVSSTMMNCAEASRPTTPHPALVAVLGASSAIIPPHSCDAAASRQPTMTAGGHAEVLQDPDRCGLYPRGGHERGARSR